MDHRTSKSPIITTVEQTYRAFLELEKFKGAERSKGVSAMSEALEEAIEQILEANTLDLETSREMAVPEQIIEWLKLTPERLQDAVDILKTLAELSDPIERVMNAPYQLNPSQTYCQRMPLGVIAFIYEAFPELAAIATGLAIKTGNSIILRGCSAGSQTNALIAQIIKNALEDAQLPLGCFEYVSAEKGFSLGDLVTQDQYINLIIPYGRPSLIQQVTQLATAPVLRAGMGNCYLYWASNSDLELVRWIIMDSHGSEPDPVNAIEKVLINANQKPSSLIRLFNSLKEKGYQLRGETPLVEEFPEHLTPMEDHEWPTSYLDGTIAFKKAENLAEAIAWINQYSSGHADCLVTESYQESRQFAQEIDSALVYINCSPRFSRHPAGTESIFLGMSNQKGHRRGLIGLETFTTVKQVVQGDGTY